MKNFAYINAASEKAAIESMSDKALALAGGTNLLNLLKEYVLAPEALVNIKGIAGLNAIESFEGGLKIGANVTLSELLDHAEVRGRYPALHQALYDIGTPQIRNMSTLGGNLCARPHCWYYRYEYFDCKKRGGQGCAAIAGDNEFHAIFATDGPCVMIHPSSAGPALVVYGAKVKIAGPGGSRDAGIEEFFTLPAAAVARENVLKPNELVTHVLLPPPNGKSATYEVRHKESHDWPLAMASVALTMAGETAQEARICLGAVAPVPWRAAAAEAALKGKVVNETTAGEAAQKAAEGAKPLSGNKYKVQLVRTAVKRAILAAATGRRV
ncbi:MAG: FAD binding domain-containing protein [Planctomycetes bacterium]|nr:FAD binding domain-containing protein [Planctomycetota bacterium]